ncbi:MAG TPA: fibronectin type III domain-containing protein [Lacipirellulaceae bacterium]|nr:fibronectin type III domain-containing protein [Lacipirellulaceae bacterium]
MLDWLGGVKRALLTGSAFFVGACSGERPAAPRRVLALEPLEPRLPMSAAGLIPVGSQPEGALTGKIVYTSGGHGWQWNTTLNRWATDRGDNNEIVEDFGNQDQLTYYVDYLWRAGATVVPMRPVGRQTNEVVLDNDSPGVTFSGSWSTNTVGPRWYDEDYGAGGADAARYRFANVDAAGETATATYTPNIPQSGFYPVYAWAAHGGNRTSQLYKVNHTGGQTQVDVDHRMVGNGWVYLGTYHFDAGSSPTAGSVEISNHSGGGGSVVIADAIRFGNGMGDVPDGPNGAGHSSGTISGYPREDENSLMWLIRALGQGQSISLLQDNNVRAPNFMAEHMNADTNPFGTSVYISFHSNAAGGRGAVGLINDPNNTNPSNHPTPNQTQLATYTGRQINQDMQALNGVFEHNWSTRTTHTYTDSFGELDVHNLTNGSNVVEMDATIIEVAFHDQSQDAQLMRDPKVRDQLARSTYQATLEYFDNFGGLNSPVSLPTAPINVRAVSQASGQVTISWSAGPTSPSGVHGAAATGYRIYASSDGYGFDGGTFVAGGATNTVTLSGYDPLAPYYFKVVAVNAGGESLGSEVLTALPSGGAKQVLIVNGFDRQDRTQNFRYPYSFTGDGLVDRVWARYNNSFDYVVQVHSAIHAAVPGVHVDSTSNEAVISGALNLNDYDTVIWILGEESEANDTFNATEQTKVEQFIASGGNLFVTGSEIAWDLDQQSGGRAFYENTLKGNYIADSAGTHTVAPAGGSIFAGLGNVGFSNGAAFSSLDGQVYNVNSADVISPQAGATAALNYGNGSGAAAIQAAGSGGRGGVVMFGFPFEAITTAANRSAVIDRVFDFFGLAAFGPDNPDFNRSGLVDTADFVVWRKNNNTSVEPGARGDANHDGLVNDADYQIWRAQYGTSQPAVSAALGSSNFPATADPSFSSDVTRAHGGPAALRDMNGSATRRAVPASFASPVRRPGFPQPAQSALAGGYSLLNGLAERESSDDETEEAEPTIEKRQEFDTPSSVEIALREFKFVTWPGAGPPGFRAYRPR